MKRVIGIGLALWALIAPLGADEPQTEPFAVIELFTSEGCSSCPPADKLLSEIAGEAKKSGKRVFPMAYHVDSWNYSGWTDPFGDTAYSKQQLE